MSFKTNAIGRYYDAITPMSTGGQPFQVFYLKNRGINVAAAISVPMGKYVINQLCLSFVWTVCLIFALTSEAGLTTVLCVVGWVMNSLLMVAIIILSVNQRVGTKLVVGIMKLLQKMKIIKNYEKERRAKDAEQEKKIRGCEIFICMHVIHFGVAYRKV